MKRLVGGIVLAVFGLFGAVAAIGDPEAPPGTVMVGILFLIGGGVLIYFGVSYLMHKKRVTETALQMLRTEGKIDAGEVAARMNISEITCVNT